MSTTRIVSNSVTAGQRGGAVLIAGGLVVLTGFFALHQSQQTGFFTAQFDSLGMFMLYGPLLLAILDSVLQVLTGQHRAAFLFEAASGLLLGLAALYFLIVFPFDFGHLADVLPEGLRVLLAWVTNDLGKIPLVIQVFAGPLGAFRAIRSFMATAD